MKTGDIMNTIKFSKITNLLTERHNLEVLNISKENIFNNKVDIYHPCNLNIFITNSCQNKCFFCINHKNRNIDISDEEYYNALEKALKELSNKGFEITITGGEPTLNPERFVKTLELCKKYNFPCRTVSTTGFNLLKNYNNKPLCQHMIENNFIHNINISRMHWDEDRNLEILNGLNITNSNIKTLATFFKLNDAEMRISCNIIPGYIDTFDKMLNFVDYYRGLNVDTVMFRELIGYKMKKLNDILELTPKNGFEHLKTLYGFNYTVDVYRYKDMLVKHYKTKPNFDKSVIFSLALNNGILTDNFSGRNIFINLKEER